jgi:hypothetical protein
MMVDGAEEDQLRGPIDLLAPYTTEDDPDASAPPVWKERNGDHLEERVDSHQRRGGFPVSARQVVPDEDQASVNMTADPITQFQGCNEHPSVLGNRAELVLTDLSEHRVRHHE